MWRSREGNPVLQRKVKRCSSGYATYSGNDYKIELLSEAEEAKRHWKVETLMADSEEYLVVSAIPKFEGRLGDRTAAILAAFFYNVKMPASYSNWTLFIRISSGDSF